MKALELDKDSSPLQSDPKPSKTKREDSHKSAVYRWEFFKRSPGFPASEWGNSKELKISRRKFLLSQRSIDVGRPEGKMKFVNLGLLGQKGEVFQCLKRKQPTNKDIFSPVSAINKQDKTMIMQLHLERKEKDIIRDMKILLYLVRNEIIEHKVNIKWVKSHWDVYDNFLRVYDFKKGNPKMTWSEIAKVIVPKEFYKNKKGDNIFATPSAKDKVRHYWRQAKKMIEEGGWKQI
jgi:hypothetical protein